MSYGLEKQLRNGLHFGARKIINTIHVDITYDNSIVNSYTKLQLLNEDVENLRKILQNIDNSNFECYEGCIDYEYSCGLLLSIESRRTNKGDFTIKNKVDIIEFIRFILQFD